MSYNISLFGGENITFLPKSIGRRKAVFLRQPLPAYQHKHCSSGWRQRCLCNICVLMQYFRQPAAVFICTAHISPAGKAAA